MITKSILAPASGSIGGITFSRNRGGAYTRLRATPTNPNTFQQQTVRSAMAALASRWIVTLTALQRQAWDTYALNVPLPNRLGDPINVGGIGMYVRSNVPRIQASLTTIDEAPTTFNLGQFNDPGITSITAATGIAIVSFSDGDDWVDDEESALLVYGSRTNSPATNYFKGPYRFAGKVIGDGVTPPTSPQNITLVLPAVAGNKTFLRMQISRADGRLSATFRDGLNAI